MGYTRSLPSTSTKMRRISMKRFHRGFFYVLIVQHPDPPQELGYTSRAPNRKFPPTSHHDLQLSRHLRIDALNGITLCGIENIYYM